MDENRTEQSPQSDTIWLESIYSRNMIWINETYYSILGEFGCSGTSEYPSSGFSLGMDESK